MYSITVFTKKRSFFPCHCCSFENQFWVLERSLLYIVKDDIKVKANIYMQLQDILCFLALLCIWKKVTLHLCTSKSNLKPLQIYNLNFRINMLRENAVRRESWEVPATERTAGKSIHLSSPRREARIGYRGQPWAMSSSPWPAWRPVYNRLPSVLAVFRRSALLIRRSKLISFGLIHQQGRDWNCTRQP